MASLKIHPFYCVIFFMSISLQDKWKHNKLEMLRHN